MSRPAKLVTLSALAEAAAVLSTQIARDLSTASAHSSDAVAGSLLPARDAAAEMLRLLDGALAYHRAVR